jgi:hypothetical protein
MDRRIRRIAIRVLPAGALLVLGGAGVSSLLRPTPVAVATVTAPRLARRGTQ